MIETRQITLLTQSDCKLCDHAKHVLARVAQDHPLVLEEVDLATARGQELARKAGVMFAPGIFLDGSPFGFGRLSERKLRQALTRSRA